LATNGCGSNDVWSHRQSDGTRLSRQFQATISWLVFFIDAGGVWLSPAYDINSSVDRQELTLAINEVETACDVSIAIEASQDYGLNPLMPEGFHRP
jgi:hypothetical protein